jgi:cell fate regulator YaaT (PSP1 superfamily)
MPQAVGVRFRTAGKVYYFDPHGIALKKGDSVIVETSRGLEYGEIVTEAHEVAEPSEPLKAVVRAAEERDRKQLDDNVKYREEVLQVGQEEITSHNLPMKLVDVEVTFDRSKITYYFAAEGWVDFRELVRDLTNRLRTRIELRQIGVRDEAKLLGGLGSCGRVLCCTTYLPEFLPVSIHMAKEQNLSLNPAKISGLCGRLMCCLRYECESLNPAGNHDQGKGCPGCPKNAETVPAATKGEKDASDGAAAPKPASAPESSSPEPEGR